MLTETYPNTNEFLTGESKGARLADNEDHFTKHFMPQFHLLQVESQLIHNSMFQKLQVLQQLSLEDGQCHETVELLGWMWTEVAETI